MNYSEARDEMLAVFNAAWQAESLPVVWSDLPSEIPSTQTPWARVTIRHSTSNQSSLSGASGAKMWDRMGTLWVQIFTPIGGGNVEGYRLAQLVTNAFQAAKSGEVWFRNSRINEVGSDGAFEQINVLTDFLYNDVR
jgi:hypothetical protein